MSDVKNNLDVTGSKQLKKGIVIIAGYHHGRDGLEEDKNAIKTTFTNLFNAEIIYWDDLTKDELKENLSTLSGDNMTEKFEKVDFLAFFILCHGDYEGQVSLPKNGKGKEPNHEGQNMNGKDKLENIKQFRKLLLGNLFKIKALNKKLKWIVVQSCRGKLNDYEKDGNDNRDYYCLSFCTGENTVSWQPNRNGKIFIQSLCRSLEENVEQIGLKDIMNDVHKRMKDYRDRNNLKNFALPETIINCNDYFFYTIV